MHYSKRKPKGRSEMCRAIEMRHFLQRHNEEVTASNSKTADDHSSPDSTPITMDIQEIMRIKVVSTAMSMDTLRETVHMEMETTTTLYTTTSTEATTIITTTVIVTTAETVTGE